MATSMLEKLRFNLGPVPRCVRVCGVASDGDAQVLLTCLISTPGADGDGDGVRSESSHEEPNMESCLQPKPIPLQLFLRR